MSTKITVTGTRYYNYEEIVSIIDIWREIFPEKIEEKYVELANLIYQYSDEAIKLLTSNSDINVVGIQLTTDEKNKQQTINDIDKMIEMLQSLKNGVSIGNVAKEDTIAFGNLFDRVWDGTIAQTNGKQKKEQKEQTYDNKRLEAGNARNAIKSLTHQIQAKLQEIDSLSINGEDRLDRIQVDDNRHLSKIDNIQGLSTKVKETLKNLLQVYMNMRVSTFKSSIEQAYEIGSAYKAHNIIDYRKQNDPRVAKQALIWLSLTTLERVFIDNLDHLMHRYSTNLEQYNVERANDFSKVMQWYTSYFNGESKSIDISSIDAFTQNNSHHINLEPLISLRNTVYQIQYQNLNTEHHK